MLAIIKVFFFSQPDPEVTRIKDELLDRRASFKFHMF